ncbi:hypothetical protein SCLCIDRAFT_1213118 [Scleroderma citrinum Foug A]|uniref:Uracil catabolism protein 4 n=1 Tax=Scleroderma citrinum Foug A TaxID=1036808 RepID=A0A0C3E8C3_9AGAM|nr:hypothetical protein SCLCIDRAFT_1213118 [Scleroderma citrinum Foug A]
MLSLLSQQDPQVQAMYLRTLPSIRECCLKVHDLAKRGGLQYFDYHPEKEDAVIEFCTSIIERDFGGHLSAIPPHGRWRHLDAGLPRIEPMLRNWDTSGTPINENEKCKRLIDLFLVSVLLDAGAGNQWSYTEKATDQTFSRSEGLGVASVHMFMDGLFSGSASQPFRVDAQGLSQITVDKVAEAMQVNSSNVMVGLEGRVSLLSNLGAALQSNPKFFGEDARPGNIIDFLEKESRLQSLTRHVHIFSLWSALIEGLTAIWPARLSLGGVPLGDVWPCTALKQPGQVEGDDLVPFHKLTGWLTYSLMEPIEVILGWKFDGVEDLTGLPEYRNGGLLVDFGVLTLRPGVLSPECYPDGVIPRLKPSHPAIVEWRAMTVIELDRIADGIRRRYDFGKYQLSLAQVLESATWKGGREIAKQLRPTNGGPPIEIESDGTVF